MKSFLFFVILSVLIFELACIDYDDNIGAKKPKSHFCGVDYLNFAIEKSSNTKIKSSNLKTRKLSTEFAPIRIFVDTKYLEEQAKNIEGMEEKIPKIKFALNKSVEGMAKLLEVKPFEVNVYSKLNSELFFNYSINNWDEQLNNTEKISLDYDYILLTRFEVPSDGFPTGVLAAAMPILLEEYTNRTIVGIMMISSNLTFFNKENADKYFSNVFIHELTHGFGFLSSIFPYFPGGIENTLFSEKDNYGINRTYIKTKKVVEFAKKYYGCNSLEGVEIENQGTGGSAGSHWEGRILLGEYMTSEQYEDEVTISEFTLSLLEDSGWYKINYYTGGLFRFGKNKGCDFLNVFCLEYDYYYSVYYTKFRDEFFAPDLNYYSSCTTGRQSRAYNLLEVWPRESVQEFSYFLPPFDQNHVYGGSIYSADFCPVNYHLNAEYNNSYFVGNCKIGNGDYGSNLYYINSTGGYEAFHPNKELPKELGEKYSDNSFCMMSNLVPNGNTSIYGSIFHPMCFPSYCSNSSLTILIFDQYIVCPREGGNVNVKGYTGKLHCPDYNLICTGTFMCNDLFDCIDKKSESKYNTYTYDYTTLTTQRYTDIDNVATIIAGEIADDGVCPKNCVQCMENKKCKKCLNKYNLIGIKEDDNQPIICDNTIDISKGYYLKDSVYYLCHSNCEKCSSGPISDLEMNCDECKKDFIYNKETKNCERKESETEEEETKKDETEEEGENEGEKEEEEIKKEDETEEEEKKNDESQEDKPSKGNIFGIIIGIVVAVVVIVLFVVAFIFLKKHRLHSEDIEKSVSQQNEGGLYSK